jgi:tRNA pseudouridine55 synthase
VTDSGIEGVLVVDKPAGMTSHDVVARIRRIAGTRRVGHTGTLDPAATGVLVVCIGRATRLVTALQAGTKTYAAVARLGVTTSSDDLDGEVVGTTSAAALDESTVCGALSAFHGAIDQVPPMVSAIRIDGERLHERARRGEIVERPPRRVVIESIVLDRFTPGEAAEVAFLVACSAGTYVRSIARDLGERLGVGGALASLRRVANGPFTELEAVTLDTLEADPSALPRHLIEPLAALRRAVDVQQVDDPAVRRALVTGARPARLGIELDPERTTALVADDLLLVVVGPGQDGPQHLVWSGPADLEART